jgi:hypothetical protein
MSEQLGDEILRAGGNLRLSPSSSRRIKRFVDWFIRLEELQSFTSERDSDFINEAERANRCYEAAEEGCDGKTHQEVIDDWRDYFRLWVREHKVSRNWGADPDRFTGAVEHHFDAVEAWHEANGSLFEQIG